MIRFVPEADTYTLHSLGESETAYGSATQWGKLRSATAFGRVSVAWDGVQGISGGCGTVSSQWTRLIWSRRRPTAAHGYGTCPRGTR